MSDFDTLPIDEENLPIPEVVEEEDDDDSFFPASQGFSLPDPMTVVTIHTTSGGDRYVPITEPKPLSEILLQAGLTQLGSVQYWQNGSQINLSTAVAPGQSINAIGAVKGG